MNTLLSIDIGSYRVGRDIAKSGKVTRSILETWFEAMTRTNVAYLLTHSKTPLLYHSGVEYERDPERGPLGITEVWLDIPNILKQGHDDCEGLSSFLAAELRCRAPNSVGPRRRRFACVKLKVTRTPGLLHARVYDPETREYFDPSRALGMGRK